MLKVQIIVVETLLTALQNAYKHNIYQTSLTECKSHDVTVWNQALMHIDNQEYILFYPYSYQLPQIL